MKRLLFGTAGIPIACSSSGGKTEDGVRYVRKLGLECMELEFVRSINLDFEKAEKVRKVAEKENVRLSCHAPYYINLNSLEKMKIGASRSRILKSARIAWAAGARSVVFHAGFYMKMDPEKVYQNIKKEIQKVVDILRDEKNRIMIRPELTGKPSQFGSLKELIRLSNELEGVLPCIDFAHLFARSIGKINNYNGFTNVLETLEKGLGKKALKNMHIHMSGIRYGPKGERNHLVLEESSFNWKELLKAWKEFGVRGTVISESPNIEKDSLLMKRTFEVMK